MGSREQSQSISTCREDMGPTATTASRRFDGMANTRVLGGLVLLTQCFYCKAADVLISSSGREPTITAGVPIDVLGNGSIVVNIAEAEWGWQYRPWLFSALASTLVSLSGVFPLVLIPLGFDGGPSKSGQGSGSTLRVMLSFAVGGLLGDVFLHLLPEAWGALPPSLPHSENRSEDFDARGNGQHIWTGMWVLVGMLVFIIVEKCCSSEKEENSEEVATNNSEKHKENVAKTFNNNVHEANGSAATIFRGKKERSEVKSHSEKHIQSPPKKVAGYLNLVANSIDNFTHGLAVGGGFSLSLRVGVFTTLAILVHEVPHEIGDFAILLRSGFSRWDAARAQLLTGSAGVLGALAASAGAAAPNEAGVSWVLPFTAGGFLHIALVSVLPELASESDPRESAKQLLGLAAGILLMAALTVLVES